MEEIPLVMADVEKRPVYIVALGLSDVAPSRDGKPPGTAIWHMLPHLGLGPES